MSAPGNKRADVENYKEDWQTPNFLWYKLHDRLKFTLDAAADATNRKCNLYLSGPHNTEEGYCYCGLCAPWKEHTVWLNPPYGRYLPLQRWVDKINIETKTRSAALLPNSTESKWFHDVWKTAHIVLFLHGRIPFEGREDGKPSQNTGGSVIPIWYPYNRNSWGPKSILWDWRKEPLPEEVTPE